MKRGFLLIALLLLAGFLSAQAALVSGGKNSIEVLYSNAKETVLQYKIGDFKRRLVEIDGKNWYHIALPKEGHIQARGLPELPVLNRSIIIDNAAGADLEVYDIEYTDMRLPVAPSKGIINRDTNPDTVPYVFDSVYNESSFFPSEIASLSEPYILRDFRGITIQTNPFAYRGDTHTLRVYTAYKVRVYSKGMGSINILPVVRSEISRAFVPLYENHFLNWQNQRYTPLNDSFGKLLVICHSNFISAIQPWVNWKRQKGIETEVVEWSTIGSTATQLKTYIQHRYNADRQLAFVQIVGDAPQIPTLSHNGGGSDPSFALVAGNDNYPDIFVGRFSAQTVSELNVQINRSIVYERDLSTNDSWLSKGMGIASSEGGIGADNNETDIQHTNIIRNKLLNYGYTTVDQIYDPGASAATVSTNINAGRGIVNYIGHGANTYWVTTGFDNNNAMALTNGNKAPFIVSVACVNGNFVSQTCFAEAWLRAPNGGAITMYASSINQSWASPMRAQDEIADLWVAEAKSTAGGYYFSGSCKMIDVYGSDGVNMYKTWNIFGDASLMVRSKTPLAMTVSHPAQIDAGSSSLSVSTGVANALVALSHNNTLYARAFCNSAGLANLSLGNLPGGNITYSLTVTAYNRVSYIGQVMQNTQQPAAGIAVNPSAINANVYSNEILHYDINLSNSGTLPLNWQASINNSWLGLNPQSGSLAAGGNSILSLTINANGLNSGNFAGSISFASNAANSPNLSLPVNIAVSAVPASPRLVAEWEPAQAALVRYPFGQPTSLLKNLSEDALLYVISTSASQSAAHNSLNNAGANMANVRYINANTDSYWTRDYAPWTIFEAGNQMKLIDFEYNRPRPNDNQIPSVMANHFNYGIYHIGMNHTGGNMMTDGMGKAMSTDLVLRENTNLSRAEINQRFMNYLGVSEYQIYSDPLTTGTIDHIDCWAKLLDVDKVMIIRVPPGHVNYNAIEASVAEWQAAQSSYGTPYRIYRVDAPLNEPYANSFIMNKNIYVPLKGTANDAAALQAYRSAMPGYNVRGYSHSNFIADDALHCRVNTIFDSQMIAIRHQPLSNLSSFTQYELSIQVDHTNALDLLSSYVAYSYSAAGPWQHAALWHTGANEYRAKLHTAHLGSQLYYYISTKDVSGRISTLPLCGEFEPFSAEVNSANPAYPAWVPAEYSSAPAKLYLDIGFFGESPATGDLVAAFVGGQCRGISRYSTDTGEPIALTVQLAAASESVNFGFYRLAEGEIYWATEAAILNSGQNLTPEEAQQIAFYLAEPQAILYREGGGIRLLWQAVQYANSYNIYSAANPEGEYNLWQNVNGNSISLDAVETRRFYRIKAVK